MSSHLTREYKEVMVTHLSNGMPWSFPVHTIHGASEGPVLGISAAVHGDEIIGSEIVRRVYQRIDEGELKGTIKLVPVANSLAFEALTRNTPMDMTNLNRVFPGDPSGWGTEQLAASLVENFLSTIDYYIDIHAGGAVPVVDYILIQNDEQMAKAFNFPVLYRPAHPHERTTATYTVSRGVPSITVEVGGGPNYEEDIERGVEGIFNVMRYLQMIPGDVAAPPKQQMVMTEIKTIRPRQGGILVPAHKFEEVGTIIEGDQVLGTIYNPRTFEVLEEIHTPFQMNLIILTRGLFNKVSPGDYGFMIGNVATAEPTLG